MTSQLAQDGGRHDIRARAGDGVPGARAHGDGAVRVGAHARAAGADAARAARARARRPARLRAARLHRRPGVAGHITLL